MRVTRNGAVTSQTRRWSKAPRSTASKGAERRGGNGRGDAEQLLSREFFEGYERRGECDDRPRPLRRHAAIERRKHDEPQDRQRDATSPQLSTRRKPSRWCKTTRAERESEPASSDPKPDGNVGWEWTRRGCVDGGAVRKTHARAYVSTNPTRGDR